MSVTKQLTQEQDQKILKTVEELMSTGSLEDAAKFVIRYLDSPESNPNLRSKLQKIYSEILEKIKAANVAVVPQQVLPDMMAVAVAPKEIDEQIEAILATQQEVQMLMTEILDNPTTKILNEDGDIIPLPSEADKAIAPIIKMDQEDVDKVAPKMEKLYRQFGEIGVPVVIEKVEDAQKKTQVQFVATYFPDEYKGTRDLTRIDDTEIRHLLECIDEAKSKAKNVEPRSKNFVLQTIGSMPERELVKRHKEFSTEASQELCDYIAGVGKRPSKVVVLGSDRLLPLISPMISRRII